MAIIKINDTTSYDNNRLCGPSKTKNKLAYSVAELRTIAKSLNIKPLPKTSIDLCHEIKKKIKAQFGVDIVVTVQGGKAPAIAKVSNAPKSGAKVPSAPKVQFDLTVDCSKKGKDSLYTLAELKAKAKQLGIPIGKLNKEPLCAEIKKKLLAAAGKKNTPVPKPVTPAAIGKKKKTPMPKPVTPAAASASASASASSKAHSPLGYIPQSDFVKIKPGLTFNMNVDCKAKKTVSNPNNYSKKDLQTFAQALGMKLKKNNLESCLAIKERIRELYKKPSPAKYGSPLEPTPTPPVPLSEKELMDAIRKCLNLKN